MTVRIPLSVPDLSGSARKYLDECIDSTYVSSVGPFVGRFETEMAVRLGVQHAVACSSGTAAIHLALVSLGITAGDEVWVSDLTFIASANPALYCGATVALVASERNTWNLDPSVVSNELDRRARRGERLPAAIVAVDVLGHPADLAPLLEAAARHSVAVVEDAAEALGANWTCGPLVGTAAGAAGRVGCLSFNGNKVMTTGGGGMLVTDDADLASLARHLSTQAKLPGLAYQHDAIGYNYRLTNIAAALGVAQLEQLDRFLDRKRTIARHYDDAFRSIASIDLPPNQPWADRSAWLYSPLFATGELRETVRRKLEENSIEARPVWTPLHTQSPYRGAVVLGGTTVADDIASRALSLPSSVGLTPSEQDEVIDLVVGAVSARV